MGWNDHDMRIDMLAQEFECAGIDYPKSYDLAVSIRQDEMRDGEILSSEEIFGVINDILEGV